tara:strand:- start:217 stop:492 length:276 start_codon:yes stop_codon:yes gene_type:complete
MMEKRMKDLNKETLIVNGSSFIQDPKNVYVCIRKRGPYGSDPNLTDRLGPFSTREGMKEMAKAVEKYGSTYKVVIEPVDYRGWRDGVNDGE